MKRRIANLLMPWVARNATVWPSTHATQAELLAEIKSLCAALERIAEEESDIDGAREIARGTLSRRLTSDEGTEVERLRSDRDSWRECSNEFENAAHTLETENERLRKLWQDEALISRLFNAHMRGDVQNALKEALDS